MTVWIIVGAGGHARSIADVITRLGDHLLAVSGEPSGRWGVPVLHDDDEAIDLAASEGAMVALGIGGGSDRLRVLGRIIAAGISSPPLVARTATVSTSAILEDGVAVLEHAHVGPWARLDRAALVNTAAVVEHDARVGSGAHVAPAAVLLGAARSGALSLVGSRAVLLPGVTVGADAIVGAGAVVCDDVNPGSTVVGVPAKCRCD